MTTEYTITFTRAASTIIPEEFRGALHNETKTTVTHIMSAQEFAELRSYLTELDAPQGATPQQRANIRRTADGALRAMAAAEKATTPVKPVPPTESHPKAIYDTLYRAFDHFNKWLFDNRLPPVVLVLHRKRNAHGYFWKGMWHRQGDDGNDISEIALNPESMGRDAKEVLSTLVHEMVHHEQHVFGKPSKSGHNVEWCEWMERIDLTPKGVGNCAGKRSGRNFTHEIIEDGLFDKAATALLARQGVDMSLFAKRTGKRRGQDRSKVKHTCPDCETNIWGKEDIFVVCGTCNQQMVPVYYR